MPNNLFVIALALLCAACQAPAAAPADAPVPEVSGPGGEAFVLEAGHASLRRWLLPTMPVPADNRPTAQRIALGQALFFDPRLSMTGQTSCASCHMPERGWGDGLPQSMRFMGEPCRATRRRSSTPASCRG